jgi:hypothetical protein
MELKIVMNDHCKLLTKCCCFLYRLKIQDGHQQGDTRVEKNVGHVQAQGFLNFFNPSPVSDLPSPNL